MLWTIGVRRRSPLPGDLAGDLPRFGRVDEHEIEPELILQFEEGQDVVGLQ
jgi:hypothetical protein